MRNVLPNSGIAVCIGLCLALLTQGCDRTASATLTDDARLAIDLGCRGREGRTARECRDLLAKLYLAKSLDPDRTIRAYCDRIRTGRWGGSRPAPPKVCTERYGGWRES